MRGEGLAGERTSAIRATRRKVAHVDPCGHLMRDMLVLTGFLLARPAEQDPETFLCYLVSNQSLSARRAAS